MKQKDIFLIVVVVIVSATTSLVLSKKLINSPKTRQQNVEVAHVITSKFDLPDKRYFNDQSFDPTKVISIGKNQNPSPFGSENH